MKIESALIRLAKARAAAQMARAKWQQAWGDCTQDDSRLFHRVTIYDHVYDAERSVWVYADWHPNAGQDATGDPLWIAQHQAWLAMKAANRELAIDRAAITRIANKLAKEDRAWLAMKAANRDLLKEQS